ncbi:MAG: ATP-binding protein, partial [Spirosomaceae bacterium]|nr:ATP-binding protein [Spirosomataceae bacterium]
MTIELHNFGPIKYFKFDLNKDLHAIFGKNNIGKSYALSAVYLILKVLKDFNGEPVQISTFSRFRMIGRYPSEDFEEKILKKVTGSQTEATVITQEFEDEIKKSLKTYFLNSFNQIFQNSFAFEYLQNKLSNEKLRITINSDCSTLTLVLNKSTQVLEIDKLSIHENIIVKK